jgi:hypothetical protein
MSSSFQKKFCGKTPNPIKMLGDLNKDGKMSSYEQKRQEAIEANSPNNYGSPLEQNSFGKSKPSIVNERSEANKYFDSITKLPGMKEDYGAHVKRKTEGYFDDEDGQFISPQPDKILSPQRHAVSVEIGKGGKSGVAGLKAIQSDEYQNDYKGFVTPPLKQVSLDVSYSKLKKKTDKKELPQKTKDSLQNKARKIGKGFYSKKHKVYVDGEDGVLSQTPVKPENYEKL